MSRSFHAGESARDRAIDFTTAFIRSKGPCAAGLRWYLRHHDQGGSYQQVLDSLVEAGRVDDACWLMDQLGPTTSLLQVDELVGEAVVFAGTIEARRGIDVGTVVRAGRAIRSGASVCAGSAIVAGTDLRARGVVRSGGSVHVGGDLWAGAGVQGSGRVHCGGRLKAGSLVSTESHLCVLGDATLRDDLLVEGDVECARALRVAGRIAVGGNLRTGHGIECTLSVAAGGHLEAGLGIRAIGGIGAGGAIRAGESIRTEGALRAGTGYGIHAGLDIPFDAWETSAVVSAASRPDRLLSGLWCDPSQLLACEAPMEG